MLEHVIDQLIKEAAGAARREHNLNTRTHTHTTYAAEKDK